MNLLIIPLFARGERKTHAIFIQFSDLQFLEEWIKSEKKEVKIRAWTWHLLIREVETIDKPPKETATKVGKIITGRETWNDLLNWTEYLQRNLKIHHWKENWKNLSLSETWIKVMLCLLAWKIWLKISVGFGGKKKVKLHSLRQFYLRWVYAVSVFGCNMLLINSRSCCIMSWVMRYLVFVSLQCLKKAFDFRHH